MKKKLEAELISIVHRILKLKNKSELDQLYLETQKLYDKLAVLKFVEENFADSTPTIGRGEAMAIVETAFERKEETPIEDAIAEESTDEDNTETLAKTAPDKEEKQPGEPEEKDYDKEQEKIQEPSTPEKEKLEAATPIEKEVDELIAEAEEEIAAESSQPDNDVPETPEVEETVADAGIEFVQPETVEEIAAAAPETTDKAFKPAFEWAFDAKEDNPDKKPEPPQSQIAFEDLLGAGYKDPVFVKPEDETKETNAPAEDSHIEPVSPPNVIPITHRDDKVPVFKMNSNQAVSLNDRLSKGITVGLNDRIAFVKNLFNNSNEDYNRVLSQLITFDTFGEAQEFIASMVKPDYNNWEGNEEYEQRFMEVVEKKFS